MPTRYAEVMADDIVYFQLRLPRDLHERTKALAARDDRSLHWEALRIYRAGLAVVEADTPPPPR